MYELKLRKAAIKALRRMRPEDAGRVRTALGRWAKDPASQGHDLVRMKGRPEFRLRIGDWRVIFERNEETREVLVKRIGSRGDVYKHVHEESGEYMTQTQPQVILDEAGAPAFAVIPWDEYDRLINAYRFAEEERLSDEELLERLDSSNEEYFPSEVVDRLLAKENPVTVYREFRGMSRVELAKAAGVNENELADMENGPRAEPARRLTAVAKALGLDYDDLV